MSYSHHTLEERKCLQELRDAGWGIRQIARATGRAASSVSRELRRNKSRKGYGFWYANNLSISRQRKGHPMNRLAQDTEPGCYVREKNWRCIDLRSASPRHGDSSIPMILWASLPSIVG